MGATAVKTVTIKSGQAVSDAVDVESYNLIAFQMPAAIDGTLARLLASNTLDGIYGVAPGWNITVAASLVVGHQDILTRAGAFRFIKFDFNGTVQTAERKVNFILKGARAMGRTAVKTVKILSGQSLSSVVDLEGYYLVAFQLPTLFDIANLTFQASNTREGVFGDVYNSGTEYTLTGSAGDRVLADQNTPNVLGPLRFLKVRSGTAAVPVNQTADRIIKVLLKS